jgi:hypothetical protein
MAVSIVCHRPLFGVTAATINPDVRSNYNRELIDGSSVTEILRHLGDPQDEPCGRTISLAFRLSNVIPDRIQFGIREFLRGIYHDLLNSKTSRRSGKRGRLRSLDIYPRLCKLWLLESSVVYTNVQCTLASTSTIHWH